MNNILDVETLSTSKPKIAWSSVKVMIYFFSVLVVTTVCVTAIAPAWAVKKSKEITYAPTRDDMALVYFIRPAAIGGKAVKLYLYVDDNPVAVLPHATYGFAYVKPGKALLWGSVIQFQAELEFIAGAEQYVDLLDMKIVPKNQGRAMIEHGLQHASTEKKDDKKLNKYLGRYDKAKELNTQVASQILAIDELPKLQKPTDITDKILLPAYTEIEVRLLENVSTAFNEIGSSLSFSVARNVVSSGQVLVSKGTRINGKVIWLRLGGTGGMPGALTIKFPYITASDGTKVPLTGHIFRTGTEKFDSAAGVSSIIGPAGSALVKGLEAFLLIGQPFVIFTRDPAWLSSASHKILDDTNTESHSEKSLPAKPGKKVKIYLDKRKKVKDVKITVASDQKPEYLEISSIEEMQIAEPLQPVSTKRNDQGWVYYFNAWQLLRHAKLIGDTEMLELLVTLSGKLKDEGSFSSDVTLIFDVHVRSSDDKRKREQRFND